MKLKQLLSAIPVDAASYGHIEINHIVFNSTDVKTGDLFVAIDGFTNDGHEYIHDAIRAGAYAIIGEKKVDVCSVPYFIVPNSRKALSQMAAVLYEYPSKLQTMIGITGTNGKTTTSYMLRRILELAKQSCSLFGSVEKYTNGCSSPSIMTTYDSVSLHRWIYESRDPYMILEVSSHGLSQHRVDSICFDYAIFTNLTQDHLDYHASMSNYYQSKTSLFNLLRPTGVAIINSSCPWGRKLIEQLRNEDRAVVTYGQSDGNAIELIAFEDTLEPTFQIREDGQIYSLQLAIPGSHNVYNAMAAITTARQLAIPMSVIAKALASFSGVPGRFETYRHPNGATVIIDYAHTPDGLRQCLHTTHIFKPDRLIHIFGFRGKRDETKWEKMMELSKYYCDETILTLDDLNGVASEEMLGLYKRYTHATTKTNEDRTMAISEAWEQIGPGDCVVISGKGSEAYQQAFALPTHSDPHTIEYLRRLTSVVR